MRPSSPTAPHRVWVSEQKYQQQTRKVSENPSVERRAETEYSVGSSARQHPEIRCEYRGEKSALPHRKISGRPVDQKSAWTLPERRHKVESPAQQHPRVSWGLVAETAGKEQSGCRSVVRNQGLRAAVIASASGITSPVTLRVGHTTGTCELIVLHGNGGLDTTPEEATPLA